jgi:tRNA A58 N-methylase Trm61
MATLLDETIAKLAAQAVRPGDTVVHLGPGAGEAAVGLARAVGPHGRLVAIEPRRALHQLLCANLARAGLWHAETHLAMPEGEGIVRREINSLRVADESLPLLLSNCMQPEPVVCWALDTLALDACSLLVMSSPLARVPVLQSARATLERLRPVVLVGVVALQHAETFEAFFAALNYRVRALQMSDPSEPAQSAHYGILVAEPMAGPQGVSIVDQANG